MRKKSLRGFADSLGPASIIFLDPDNGIAVPSVRPGSRVSSKYIFIDEICLLWEMGHSLVIYQHFPRVKREPYTQAHLRQLSKLFGFGRTSAILTSHVAFLFCFQDAHLLKGLQTVENATRHWMPATRSITVRKGENGDIDVSTLDFSHAQRDLPL